VVVDSFFALVVSLVSSGWFDAGALRQDSSSSVVGERQGKPTRHCPGALPDGVWRATEEEGLVEQSDRTALVVDHRGVERFSGVFSRISLGLPLWCSSIFSHRSLFFAIKIVS
jgi:hypothetical protein